MLILLLILAFLFSHALPAEDTARQARAKLMFYNVENMFDAVHDQGKEDWSFLPKDYPNKREMCIKTSSERYLDRCLEADWTEHKVELKINQIARVIRDAGRPDIVGLAEVENKKVLSRLAAKLGYRGVLITEGKDRRGIDVAMLYRTHDGSFFKYIKHSQHEIKARHVDGLRNARLRPMLEVEFRAGNQHLHVFVVHWASPGNPTEYRLASARKLIGLVKERVHKNRNAAVVAMGDFNVVARDYPHPFRERFFASNLFDIEAAYKRSDTIPWELKNMMPFGTHFYPPRMSWDSLDRVFMNRQLRDGQGLEIDVPSFKIFTRPYMAKTFVYEREGEYHNGSMIKNVPKRYDYSSTNAGDAGFSDHYPILVDLYM